VLILSRRDTIVKARQNVNRSSTKLLFHAGYQRAAPADIFLLRRTFFARLRQKMPSEAGKYRLEQPSDSLHGIAALSKNDLQIA